jgi:hypothetical protein
MKKIILIVMCICLPLLWSGAHAEESKKFSYCGENIKFYIPAFIDRKSLEKQSEPYTCKNGFTLKSKIGNKQTHIEIRPSDTRLFNVKDFDEDWLAQFTSKYPHRLHYILSNDTPNGRVIINKFYWLNEQSILREVQDDIYFGKEDKFFVYASYTANPNDPNDILFMNALEQLFLSAEIDW